MHTILQYLFLRPLSFHQVFSSTRNTQSCLRLGVISEAVLELMVEFSLSHTQACVAFSNFHCVIISAYQPTKMKSAGLPDS